MNISPHQTKSIITQAKGPLSQGILTVHVAWIVDDADLFLYGVDHGALSTPTASAREPLQEHLVRFFQDAPLGRQGILKPVTRGALLPHGAGLRKQKVEGFSLPLWEGLSWLVGYAPPEVGCGFRFADDVQYFAAAAKFAVALIRHHRYLPAIDGWIVDTVTKGYAQRYTELLRAMPPSARAWGRENPEQILSHFFSRIAHTAVRRAAARWRESRWHRLEKTFPQWMLPDLRPNTAPVEPTVASPSVTEAVKRWLALLHTKENDTRACFRLQEPESEGELWTLTFLLQSVADPSLLVSAAAVWQRRTRSFTHIRTLFTDPQETLLEGLGRAARLAPFIEKSLSDRAPAACDLSTPEAYRFLTETSFLLKESGFGVLLPSFWTIGEREKLGVRARVHAKGQRIESGFLGAGAVFQFDWRVSLGGHELTAEEFQRLSAMKSGLVRLRGQWVEVAEAHLERIRKLMAQGGRERALGEFLRMRAEGAIAGVPVQAIETDRAGNALVQCLDETREITATRVPSSFVGRLRPYQEKGVSWLAFILGCGFGACLADDMGLGKTVQLLALLLHYKESGKLAAPALLISPASVLQNWQREAQKFTPALKVFIHHGAGRIAGNVFKRQVAAHDLILTTYALARRDLALLSKVPWSGVVLDEAQNIKNPAAAQAKAVRALPRNFSVALTGTPVENNLTDLWSISEFLNPQLLGVQDNFHKSFTVPIQRYGDEKKREALKRIMQPFLLRRLKTDKTIIADLPEKLEMQVLCAFTREQATLYEAVAKEALRAIEEAEGMERRGVILATITKLKQVCNHPAHFLKDGSALPGRSGKLDRLTEMLEECVEEGDSALVFTQFTAMGALLEQYLRASLRADVYFLHGGVPVRKRPEIVSRFQNNGSPAVFVLSLKAGGVGLNLTAASHVFHFDRWWNPAVENQATDRAFRIGQTKRVQVHKFTCAGTLEERIQELIESKKALAESIIGAGEAWLTELSTAELRNLFTLRKEYVF